MASAACRTRFPASRTTLDRALGAILNRQYPPLHAAFRGEMMRFVLGALRTATKPLTSREIADTVMDGRGLNKDDPKVAQMIRKRVITCLWKTKQRGLARDVVIEGDLKGWQWV